MRSTARRHLGGEVRDPRRLATTTKRHGCLLLAEARDGRLQQALDQRAIGRIPV